LKHGAIIIENTTRKSQHLVKQKPPALGDPVEVVDSSGRPKHQRVGNIVFWSASNVLAKGDRQMPAVGVHRHLLVGLAEIKAAQIKALTQPGFLGWVIAARRQKFSNTKS
jgi:hypothetical protein